MFFVELSIDRRPAPVGHTAGARNLNLPSGLLLLQIQGALPAEAEICGPAALAICRNSLQGHRRVCAWKQGVGKPRRAVDTPPRLPDSVLPHDQAAPPTANIR